MTEILTESFCERCGTRYTFESARPKERLKGVRVLSRGLKNFVLSDDTSIDEAMAAARSETDRQATAHQLDAFHKTFNFCMGCRQYTCPNCWNEPEARCLSCAPLALPEAPARLEDVAAFGGTGLIGESELIGAASGNGAGEHEHEHETWPEAVEANAEATTSELGELATAEPVADDTLEPDLAQPGIAADADAVSDDVDPAGKAAAQTTGLLRRFRPGQSIDDELAAYELERSEAQGVAATESGIAASSIDAIALEAEGAAAAEADEVAAAAGVAATAETTEGAATGEPAEPESTIEAPVAASAAPEAGAGPEPEPLAAAPADVVEQPTWRISAPDPGGTVPIAPSSEPAPQLPLQASAAQADASAEPQWPARPQWPGGTPAAGLPFLGRPAAPQGGIEALWAASNQELVTAVTPAGKPAASGIQPCISCGLSLSATARFCRRCGTLQTR
jgi:hypothetical protein